MSRSRTRDLIRTLRFIRERRLYLPRYFMCALRFIWLKVTKPHIQTEGFVFIAPNVELDARRGYGRITLGKWVIIGPGNAIHCHEGSIKIGAKSVIGGYNTFDVYRQLVIGDECIFANHIYVSDFDHRFDDLERPIRKQGIVCSPVEIGRDCWIGEKATILRGVTIGEGSVIGSHSLVNRDVPPRSVVGGVPARVLKKRDEGQRA
jgi:acetyltransferase-like isoleucine patch superfamily enzyme